MQKLFRKSVFPVFFVFLLSLIFTNTIFAQVDSNKKIKIDGILNQARYFGGKVIPAIATVELKPGYTCKEPPFSRVIQIQLMTGKSRGKLAWYYLPPISKSLTNKEPRPGGYIMGAQENEKPVIILCTQPVTKLTAEISLPSVIFYGAN